MTGDLTVTCTGTQTHLWAELARFSWAPRSLDSDQSAVWDANQNDDLIVRPLPTTARGLRRGDGSYETVRKGVEIIERADGGRTFDLPPCPRCGEHYRLRDDTLAALRSLGSIDWSVVAALRNAGRSMSEIVELLR